MICVLPIRSGATTPSGNARSLGGMTAGRERFPSPLVAGDASGDRFTARVAIMAAQLVQWREELANELANGLKNGKMPSMKASPAFDTLCCSNVASNRLVGQLREASLGSAH